ncbi:MAG: M16 family metallopeptidase [Pyrinomonadaceae bacterium]
MKRILELRSALVILFAISAGLALATETFAQIEGPPAPGAPRSVSIPPVKESRLSNGLTVAVVERRAVPIVTIQLMVKRGASSEIDKKAGLANLTASMLTKGTKTRNATQIAQEIEFLGGSIGNGAGWNNSNISVTVTSDKLDQAMAILADVALNPNFDQKELDLLKSQTLDGLTYNLKQPGFLGNYVASKYSFGEHPAGGTPVSLSLIKREDVIDFHSKYYAPNNSVLIFAGDVAAETANAETQKYFGAWRSGKRESTNAGKGIVNAGRELVNRILVVDLPDSGQASVTYARGISGIGRGSKQYTSASVLNSVLGGGYSSRLNQEIRIKRGLSYGAGSSFAWRSNAVNFGTRTQTKNESAAEVAELVMTELEKLATGSIAETELVPRKSVLTGNFGRNLETTEGLANAIGDLYSFGLPASELNTYITNVNAVRDADIGSFARANINSGDIVIVGDYAKFKDDLARRFPKTKIKVIKASELDLTAGDLTK